MGRHVGAPSDGHQHGGRKPAKTSGVYLGYFKAFLLSAELSRIDIGDYITSQLIRPKQTGGKSMFSFTRHMRAAIASVTHYAKI